MYTEGKWEIDLSGSKNWRVGCTISIIANGKEVALVRLQEETSSKSFRENCLSPENEEGMANAHLIAAAPALLEALKELVSIIDGIVDGVDYKIDSFTAQPARQAISEAEK